MKQRGFTLIELLVVVAIISILASMMFPALGRVRGKSQQISCLSNLRQIGLGVSMYLGDNGDRFPDARQLKTDLGYKPWSSWPPSDPRGGWVPVVLSNQLVNDKIWVCPNFNSPQLHSLPQCWQLSRPDDPASEVSYWFWRFDRTDDPVPLDNFWSKTVAQSVLDLAAANNPQAGQPSSGSDVELAVDPYFPNTIAALPPEVRGMSVHPKGRNVLYLDSHTAFLRDARLK